MSNNDPSIMHTAGTALTPAAYAVAPSVDDIPAPGGAPLSAPQAQHMRRTARAPESSSQLARFAEACVVAGASHPWTHSRRACGVGSGAQC